MLLLYFVNMYWCKLVKFLKGRLWWGASPWFWKIKNHQQQILWVLTDTDTYQSMESIAVLLTAGSLSRSKALLSWIWEPAVISWGLTAISPMVILQPPEICDIMAGGCGWGWQLGVQGVVWAVEVKSSTPRQVMRKWEWILSKKGKCTVYSFKFAPNSQCISVNRH